jgi:hypothetical protein
LYREVAEEIQLLEVHHKPLKILMKQVIVGIEKGTELMKKSTVLHFPLITIQVNAK